LPLAATSRAAAAVMAITAVVLPLLRLIPRRVGDYETETDFYGGYAPGARLLPPSSTRRDIAVSVPGAARRGLTRARVGAIRGQHRNLDPRREAIWRVVRKGCV
jgi:hypothetical protein